MSPNSSTGNSEDLLVPRGYTRLLLALVGSGTILIALFNAAVDPYDWFGWRMPGFNAKKEYAYKMDRISKIRDAARHAAPAGCVGTSRVAMGFDPEHTLFAGDGYNLGMTAANMYESHRNLQHLHALQPQNTAVLGIGLFMFNESGGQAPLFGEQRLRVRADGGYQLSSHWADLPAILWSTSACEASWTTLGWQDNDRDLRYRRGRLDPDGMDHYLRTHHGQEFVFQLQEVTFMQQFLGFRYEGLPTDGKPAPGSQLATFADCLDFCRREDIDLHICITPIHARLGEVIAACGHWNTFERLKRDLTRLVAAEAARADAQPFPLQDFATYTRYNCEETPPLGDLDARMRWYWELSHFRQELGDIVLDRLAGRADPEVPAAFGVRLEPGRLAAHLRAVRARRDAYRHAHREHWNRLLGRFELTRLMHFDLPLPARYRPLVEAMQAADMLEADELPRFIETPATPERNQ